jgi:hypothetical protein
MRSLLAIAMVLMWVSGPVRADELSQLSGRVLDRSLDTAVSGALVHVSGPGVDRSLTSDATGHYTIALRPGTYRVTFVYGKSKNAALVTVGGGATTFDGHVDSLSGEVIVIHERLKPPVPPKPTNYKRDKAPPYSDHAVLSDAWTKAHMLLDIDENGTVVRFKWLKKPGYDLEQIAVREVFALKFTPARDAHGKAIKAWIPWTIEWPSAWWLEMFVGTRSGMPPYEGIPPRRKDEYVPCRGSGPWNLGSLHPTYRDCSKPDLSKAADAPWVER